MNGNELPGGWAGIRLGELCSKIGSGSTPRGGQEAYQAAGIPLIRSMNVHMDGLRTDGLAYLDDSQAATLDGVIVEPGDVLLNITGASIGRVALAAEWTRGARVNQHVMILRPTKKILPGYLRGFLASPEMQAEIGGSQYGATRQALTKQMVSDFDIPVASLPEQRRIVAKLEALQARSRRAREALEAVPPLLEKLRQSILAAAFRGDLTKDWREKHPDVEPASELLKRIRVERRKKWEEGELAKITAKGKAPTDSKWKLRYVEPEAVDDSELPELPEGWCWASVDEVSSQIVDCLHRTPEYGSVGYPAIRTADVIPGRLLLDGAKRVDEMTYREQIARLVPIAGDIFYSREGERFGLAACVPNTPPVCISQRMMHLRAAPGINSHCLMWALNSPVMYQQAVKGIGGSTSPHVNIGDIKLFAVPVPPSAEQHQLAGLVERLWTHSDGLVRALHQLKSDSGSLDSAILSKAFRGELVPQEASDEVEASSDALSKRSNSVPAQAKDAKERNRSRTRSW